MHRESETLHFRATVRLTLRCSSGRTASLDFLPESDRGYTVGSARNVDVRFDEPKVPHVAFYFERRGSRVWLVPAFASANLRVGARKVHEPCPLDASALIEFAKIRLRAEVRVLDDELPHDVFDAPTEIACAPFGTDDTAATAQTEIVELPAAALSQEGEGGTSDSTIVEVKVFGDGVAGVSGSAVERASGTKHSAKVTRVISWFDFSRDRPSRALGLGRILRVRIGREIARLAALWSALRSGQRTVLVCSGIAAAALVLLATALVVHAGRLHSGATRKVPPSAPAQSRSMAPAQKIEPARAAAPTKAPSGPTPPVVTPSADTASDPQRARAVLDLVSGRLDSAQKDYAALAALNPSRPVYGVLARLIARRIAATNSIATVLPEPYAVSKP